MSLTALAKLLTGKQYSIAGPKHFKYKGEWLNDIRHRLNIQNMFTPHVPRKNETYPIMISLHG